MNDAPAQLVFSRVHANRFVATILQLHDVHNDLVIFLASAAPTGHMGYSQTARSLGGAQALADEVSGCAQPCTCAPWTEAQRLTVVHEEFPSCPIVLKSRLRRQPQ